MEIRNGIDGIILDVGSDGARVWNIAINVGYSSVGIRDIGTNFRRGSMDSRWKFGLGAKSVVIKQKWSTERTLKT